MSIANLDRSRELVGDELLLISGTLRHDEAIVLYRTSIDFLSDEERDVFLRIDRAVGLVWGVLRGDEVNLVYIELSTVEWRLT